MLANFLKSQAVRDNYEITFAFRNSPEYRSGLFQRVQSLDGISISPLPVFDPNPALAHLAARFGRVLASAIAQVAALTGVFLLVDIYNLIALYKNLFRNKHFDIVHINNGGYPGARSAIAAAAVARMTRQGPVIYCVNNIATSLNIRTTLQHGWWNLSLKFFVAQFVTASMVAARALQASLNLEAIQITTIHNGIQPRACTQTRTASREALGISESVVAFGIVAILEPRKGHRYAIEAAAYLRDVRDKLNFKLLIEGDGPLARHLKSLVSALNLEEQVTFVGKYGNISDFYNAIDALIVPSISNEDFPNVVLEGMHHCLPIIGTNIAGIPEQIDNEITGYVVEPGQCRSLANQMNKLLDNRELRLKMGRFGQEAFNMKFKSEMAVNNYLKLYSRITHDHSDRRQSTAT